VDLSNQRSGGRAKCTAWVVVPAWLFFVCSRTGHAEPPAPRDMLGTYYFNRWSGKTNHVTELLATKYVDRKPIWGWKCDTVEIMQQQIDSCLSTPGTRTAKAGI
jgi:hypothetical protein